MLKICLIEDHVLVSEAIMSFLIANNKDLEVKTFSGGEGLSVGFSEWKPDVVIMDWMLPDISGPELIRYLKKEIDCKVIVLSSISDVATVKLALKTGVQGFVTKDAPLSELIEAIDAVLRGEEYVNSQLSKNLIKNIFVESRLEMLLTDREKEVLQYICKGFGMKEIAFELNLSVNTIHTFHRNIMQKFHVNKSTDLILEAIRAGLFSPQQKS